MTVDSEVSDRESAGRSVTDETPGPTIGQARLAGAVAAGVALGVGEVVTGFGSRNQSLVGSVGNQFIRDSGGGVARTAISVLGTADKPSLVIGIVVVSLLLGALLGGAARHRPWIAVVGFCAFGLVGVLASADDPLASTGLAVIAARVLGGRRPARAVRAAPRGAHRPSPAHPSPATQSVEPTGARRDRPTRPPAGGPSSGGRPRPARSA